jgi:hypothetical protein
MLVTTLGEAFRLGWRVKGKAAMANACRTIAELDMRTLVWTRGEAFPLDMLESRLKCPRCGGRRVQVIFEPPAAPGISRVL